MQTLLLKAKLHKACVSHAELNYEDSCAKDSTLLVSGCIREYEFFQI